VDAEFLHGRVLGGSIFGGFSTEERATIWENILAFKGIIPSLSTFFQDIKLLEACVNGIKWLVEVPRHQTLFTALGECYSQPDTQILQTTETTCRCRTGSPTHGMKLGYLQLFAFAMRHYKDLPKAPVKKDVKEMPRATADREVLQRFASFAARLGFTSPEIEKFKGVSEDITIADTEAPIPIIVTTGSGENMKQRCGLPPVKTFRGDTKYVFLDNFCQAKDETGEGITSFFVLKCWFVAFFGQWLRDVSSIEIPDSAAAHCRHTDGADLNMGEAESGISNQSGVEKEDEHITEDPERSSTDEEMQETAVQQIVNDSSTETNDEEMQETAVQQIVNSSTETNNEEMKDTAAQQIVNKSSTETEQIIQKEETVFGKS
jgi:Protein of unknown function (DUF3723)